MTRKGFAPIVIVLIIAAAIFLGAAGYALVKHPNSAPAALPPVVHSTSAVQVPFVSHEAYSSHSLNATVSGTGDTSRWKTYQNFKYGFELKFPPEASVESAPDLMPIVSFDADAVMNVVWVYNMSGLSINEYFDGSPGTNFVGTTKPANIKQVMVGGLKATQFAPSDLPYQRFLVVSLEDRFLLFSTFVRGSERDKKDALFDKIISTFAFIEPLDIAAWNTYRDNENRFQFKYPKILRWEVNSNKYTIGYPVYLLLFTSHLNIFG